MVLSTKKMCLPSSHAAAGPLYGGLRTALEAIDIEVLALAMPTDSGITADHAVNCVDRFSRREGLPGHTAYCDCGEWKKKFHAAPRVLACPAASRYS